MNMKQCYNEKVKVKVKIK